MKSKRTGRPSGQTGQVTHLYLSNVAIKYIETRAKKTGLSKSAIASEAIERAAGIKP